MNILSGFLFPVEYSFYIVLADPQAQHTTHVAGPLPMSRSARHFSPPL